MDLLQWLFDSSSFKAPVVGGGWTPQMQRLSDICVVILFLSFVGIPALFLVLGGGFFRVRRIAVWMSALMLTVAAMFLLQGLMSAWPAYRFLLAIRAFAAVYALLTMVVLLPAGIAERHEHHLSRQEEVLEELHRLRDFLEERKEMVNHVVSGLLLEPSPGETAQEEADGAEPRSGRGERPPPSNALGAEE